MGNLASQSAPRRRIARKPTHVLIGHKLYSASEIEPAAPLTAALCAAFIASIEAHLAILASFDDPSAAPVAAAKAGSA